MPEQAVQTVLFPTLFAKPLVATFDTPHQSSDGGAVLLKAIDDELDLTARLAACIPEWRQAGKIAHDLPTLIRQRCFGLACGYADANDAAQLKADPIHKLLVPDFDTSRTFPEAVLKESADLQRRNAPNA